MAQAFGSNIPESTHNKNRIDPFYGYGQLDQSGMAGLQGGEQAGTGHFNEGWGNMAQSLAMYNQMAAGQGPSLAQNLARQQTGQNIAAQQAMMAQGRGGAAAGQQRAAALAGQSLQAQSTGAVANARVQEQLGAMQGAAQLGTAMGQMGQQQQLGYAGMLNQAQIAQMNTAAQYELQQRALQQQERMGRFQRHFGWANLGRQWIGDVVNGVEGGMSGGAMSDERMKHDIQPAGALAGPRYPTMDQVHMGEPTALGQANTAEALAARSPVASADPHGFIEPMPPSLAPVQSGFSLEQYDMPGMMEVKPAVKGPVGGGSTSDERAKHGVQGAGPRAGAVAGPQSEASALAGTMQPYSFEYNPGQGPPGRRLGIMAQELEQSPLGRQLVIDTPQGKVIDTPQATNAALGMIADQEQRLRRLEGGMPVSAGDHPHQAAGRMGAVIGPDGRPTEFWETGRGTATDRMSQRPVHTPLRGENYDWDTRRDFAAPELTPDQRLLLATMQELQGRTTFMDEGGVRRLRARPIGPDEYRGASPMDLVEKPGRGARRRGTDEPVQPKPELARALAQHGRESARERGAADLKRVTERAGRQASEAADRARRPPREYL